MVFFGKWLDPSSPVNDCFVVDSKGVEIVRFVIVKWSGISG